MESKVKTKTQLAAAARTDISISSAHRIEKGIVTGDPRHRTWSTREDPFKNIWPTVIKPQLELHPSLMAITILEGLQNDYPSQYPDKLLRTLQRKIKKWRLHHGPKKEVIFHQEHFPGRMGISDFTSLKTVTIKIDGEPFKHILYHFRLSYSGWSYVKVIQGGESIPALLEGLQEAIWRVGGSPKEHRTDSLSSAYKNIHKNAQDDLTKSYEEFCDHYTMTPTRNNKGVSHENGSIESPHGHVKKRMAQALLLRGDNNFENIESYQRWVDSVLASHNRRNAKQVDFERDYLTPLPLYKTTDFVEQVVRVHNSSTLEIKRVTYSVPSRLIGETLRAHIYQGIIDLYHGSGKVHSLERVHVSKKQKRAKQINYKHIIHSLHKKPQAFMFSQIRDSLLPTEDFKIIWDKVCKEMSRPVACKYIVKLLYIANKYDCERDLTNYVMQRLDSIDVLTLSAIESRYKEDEVSPPPFEVHQHSLSSYNNLIH
jgi:hypothetical protein